MATKIKLIRSVEYLHTSVDGQIDFKKSVQVLATLAKAKRPPADYDVILDMRRSQVKLLTTDIWYLAKVLTKHDNMYRDKIAILILPGMDFKKAEFFELCSKNRGLKVDIFTNYEDVIQWFFANGDSDSY